MNFMHCIYFLKDINSWCYWMEGKKKIFAAPCMSVCVCVCVLSELKVTIKTGKKWKKWKHLAF